MHPKASDNAKVSRYPLGCALCRSEKLDKIENNEDAELGIALEKRNSMITKFDHVHGHALDREMKVVRKGFGHEPAVAPSKGKKGGKKKKKWKRPRSEASSSSRDSNGEPKEE